jgi:hypothetical protein
MSRETPTLRLVPGALRAIPSSAYDRYAAEFHRLNLTRQPGQPFRSSEELERLAVAFGRERG